MSALRMPRVLVLVGIVLVVVIGGVSVASARPDLDNAKQNVGRSWTRLRGDLTGRYTRLKAANDAVRGYSGPVRDLSDQLNTALVGWSNSATGSVASQVAAANQLEPLGRRLVATARASERVKRDQAASAAIDAYASDPTFSNPSVFGDIGAFNNAVARYERERRGPVRVALATVLGDGNIPAYAPASIAS